MTFPEGKVYINRKGQARTLRPLLLTSPAPRFFGGTVLIAIALSTFYGKAPFADTEGNFKKAPSPRFFERKASFQIKKKTQRLLSIKKVQI